MRARLFVARACESANALPPIFGGSGMGAQKAAWQAAFMAEAAALTKREYAEGIVDFVKAVETVPHAILADIAKTKGYSLVVLRLCLAAYRLHIAIGVDGTFSRLNTPRPESQPEMVLQLRNFGCCSPTSWRKSSSGGPTAPQRSYTLTI